MVVVEANRWVGIVFGCIGMIAGALLSLNATAFQSKVLAFYRRNPHLQFDLGWTPSRSFVLFARCCGVVAFAIGAAMTTLLLTQ